MIELRQATAADWDAISALADESVRRVPSAGKQIEWSRNRISFSGRRWHFAAERFDGIVGYGSLEAQAEDAGSSFRQFLVVNWGVDASTEIADGLSDRLCDVARSEQVSKVWMREFAEDEPLLNHLLARGFALDRRYIWNDHALVDLSRPDPQHDYRIVRTRQVSDAQWQALGALSGDVWRR